MLKRFAALAVLWAASLSPVQAENAVVVELYTSQGCSSCPPADNLLGQIADRDDIIALALHVDYWDYIGWTDAFADPAHTTRQRAYARAKGSKMIYTPQMIVQGEAHVIGTKSMELADAINAAVRAKPPVSVSLTRNGDRVSVQAEGRGSLPSDIAVHVVSYTPEASVSIRAGENRGRTLTYHNIVESWRTVGEWSGRGAYARDLEVPAGQPVAVIFQAPGHGRILGAAKLQ